MSGVRFDDDDWEWQLQDQSWDISMFQIELCLLGTLLRKRNKKKRLRECYVRQLNGHRNQQGEMANLVEPMMEIDHQWFFRYMRQSPQRYRQLSDMLCPHLKHMKTHISPINESTRIVVAIRYFVTGQTTFELASSFRIGVTTVNSIIKEVAEVIVRHLGPLVLPPVTTKLLMESAQGYHDKWNFTHCSLTADGKHCAIRAPRSSGSVYYSHKQSFSVILMAAVAPDLTFIYANCGTPGANSDSTVFDRSWLGQNIQQLLPAASEVDGEQLPFVCLGDQGFALRPWFLRPYSTMDMESSNPVDKHRKAIFNYRLSRARRTTENAFGILIHRFRCMRRIIEFEPETAVKIIMACVCLHNWLMRGTDYGSAADTEDKNKNVIPGEWRKSGEPLPSAITLNNKHNSTKEAQRVRDQFSYYFIGRGKVDWQSEMIRRGYK